MLVQLRVVLLLGEDWVILVACSLWNAIACGLWNGTVALDNGCPVFVQVDVRAVLVTCRPRFGYVLLGFLPLVRLNRYGRRWCMYLDAHLLRLRGDWRLPWHLVIANSFWLFSTRLNRRDHLWLPTLIDDDAVVAALASRFPDLRIGK